MKLKKSIWLTGIALVFVWAIQVRLVAQNSQDHQHNHHRYKLVDFGTLGGPQSYFDNASGYEVLGVASILNNNGTVAGFADTVVSDPFPNFCFYNCYVTHTFQAGSDGRLADLGALRGGGSSAANWVTDNGLVTGVSENGETDPLYAGLPQLRAVLWQNGRIRNLGTLPEGGYQSQANSVNSAGQVVGTALNTTPDANSMQVSNFWLWGGIVPAYEYQTRAFFWDQQHGMQDLGTLGGSDAMAMLINERGQVVGYSYVGSTPSSTCAFPLATDSFVWERGKGMLDLGGFGGTCTLATNLNQRGQIVGSSNLAGDQLASAFRWENGKIRPLGGSLGGSFTGAFGLNEEGQAAGYGYLAGDGAYHATLWKQPGQIIDLGVIGDDQCSFAAVMNARGQVAGSSFPVCNSDGFRAVLWEDGSIFDLNTLIPPKSPLYLSSIYAINDRGEMAGEGEDADGNGHAFLLIPCDENHPGIEGCDYSLMDGEAGQIRPAPLSPRPPVVRPNNPSRQKPSWQMGPGPRIRSANTSGASCPSRSSRADNLLDDLKPPAGSTCRKTSYFCSNEVTSCQFCGDVCVLMHEFQTCWDVQYHRYCHRCVL